MEWVFYYCILVVMGMVPHTNMIPPLFNSEAIKSASLNWVNSFGKKKKKDGEGIVALYISDDQHVSGGPWYDQPRLCALEDGAERCWDWWRDQATAPKKDERTGSIEIKRQQQKGEGGAALEPHKSKQRKCWHTQKKTKKKVIAPTFVNDWMSLQSRRHSPASQQPGADGWNICPTLFFPSADKRRRRLNNNKKSASGYFCLFVFGFAVHSTERRWQRSTPTS